MRWLFWTGGSIALAGLVWLVQIADVSGSAGTRELLGPVGLFLGGLVVAGLSLAASVGDEGT